MGNVSAALCQQPITVSEIKVNWFRTS